MIYEIANICIVICHCHSYMMLVFCGRLILHTYMTLVVNERNKSLGIIDILLTLIICLVGLRLQFHDRFVEVRF